MSEPFTRRAMLTGSLAAAAGIVVADSVSAAPARTDGFRFAHMTDMHVKPERGSPDGFAKSLQSLGQLNPAPRFIITGGDHIMDALLQKRERTDAQWDLYLKVLRENTKLKAYPVLGNHDIWGWSAKEDWDNEPGFGKTIAQERLELPRTYYTFDAGGWKFIMLDNVLRRGKAYYSDLDPEQLEWLKGELAANGSKKPVCVVSHVPVVSVCALFFYYGSKGTKKPADFWKCTDNLLMRDTRPLVELFSRSNVKLCISGHIHLLDRVKYMNVEFLCDGAVSGAWWGGPMQEVAEGYGVFDFYPDGTFDHQYITFGWQPPKG